MLTGKEYCIWIMQIDTMPETYHCKNRDGHPLLLSDTEIFNILNLEFSGYDGFKCVNYADSEDVHFELLKGTTIFRGGCTMSFTYPSLGEGIQIVIMNGLRTIGEWNRCVHEFDLDRGF